MWDYFIAKAPLTLPALKIKSRTDKGLEDLLKPIKEILLPSDSDSDSSSVFVRMPLKMLNCENIISQVLKRWSIWDQTSKGYHNRVPNKILWSEVAEDMQATGDFDILKRHACRTGWRVMELGYCKGNIRARMEAMTMISPMGYLEINQGTPRMGRIPEIDLSPVETIVMQDRAWNMFPVWSAFHDISMESLEIVQSSECKITEVIDIFKELHKDSFLRPLPGTKTKFMSKQEADHKTVDQFTDGFKKTMREVRENLKFENTLLISEDEQTIEHELCGDKTHIFFDNRKIDTEEAIVIEPEVVDSEATSNSAVWNMIKANQKAYFSTSPPHYDVYDLKPDHYLKRPHVAWEEVEDSRRKCEKWLDECEIEIKY